jgi:hypothetical protein
MTLEEYDEQAVHTLNTLKAVDEWRLHDRLAKSIDWT